MHEGKGFSDVVMRVSKAGMPLAVCRSVCERPRIEILRCLGSVSLQLVRMLV